MASTATLETPLSTSRNVTTTAGRTTTNVTSSGRTDAWTSKYSPARTWPGTSVIDTRIREFDRLNNQATSALRVMVDSARLLYNVDYEETRNMLNLLAAEFGFRTSDPYHWVAGQDKEIPYPHSPAVRDQVSDVPISGDQIISEISVSDENISEVSESDLKRIRFVEVKGWILEIIGFCEENKVANWVFRSKEFCLNYVEAFTNQLDAAQNLLEMAAVNTLESVKQQHQGIARPLAPKTAEQNQVLALARQVATKNLTPPPPPPVVLPDPIIIPASGEDWDAEVLPPTPVVTDNQALTSQVLEKVQEQRPRYNPPPPLFAADGKLPLWVELSNSGLIRNLLEALINKENLVLPSTNLGGNIGNASVSNSGANVQSVNSIPIVSTSGVTPSVNVSVSSENLVNSGIQSGNLGNTSSISGNNLGNLNNSGSIQDNTPDWVKTLISQLAERSGKYEKDYVRVDPTKLEQQSDYRIWLGKFQMYVARYTWAKCFDLENPEIIPEIDTAKRLHAKEALVQWLGDVYLAHIHSESCPTKSLRIIQEMKEPKSEYCDVIANEILKIEFNPRHMSVDNYFLEVDKLNRRLAGFSEWTEERLIKMVRPKLNAAFICLSAEPALQEGQRYTYSDLKCYALKHEISFKASQRLQTDRPSALKKVAKRFGNNEDYSGDDQGTSENESAESENDNAAYKFKFDKHHNKGYNRRNNKGYRKRNFKGNYKSKFSDNKSFERDVTGAPICHYCRETGHTKNKCPKLDTQKETRSKGNDDHQEKKDRNRSKRSHHSKNRSSSNKYRRTSGKSSRNASGNRKAYATSHRDRSASSGSSGSYRSASGSPARSSARIARRRTSDSPSRESRRESQGELTSIFHKALNLGNKRTIERRPTVIKMIADSGATDHIVGSENLFREIQVLDPPIRVSCANGKKDADLVISKKGTVRVTQDDGSHFDLEDVFYSEDADDNLLSLFKLVQEKSIVLLSRKGVVVLDEKTRKIRFQGKMGKSFWQVVLPLVFDDNRSSAKKIRKVPNIHRSPRSNRLYRSKRTRRFAKLGGNNGNSSGNESDFSIQSIDVQSIYSDIHSARGASACISDFESVSDCESVGKNSIVSGISDISENSVFSIAEIEELVNFEEEEEVPIQTESDNEDEEFDLKTLASVPDDKLEDYLNSGANTSSETLVNLDRFRDRNLLRRDLWYMFHVRLGHVSFNYLKEAAQYIPLLRSEKPDDTLITMCEVCKLTKIKRTSHKKKRTRLDKPLARIHSDVMGKLSPMGVLEQSYYIVTFTDDYSRYTQAYELKDKRSVHIYFKEFIQDSRTIIGDSQARIRYFRTDGGSEFETTEMCKILADENIIREITPPATPQLNGVAERVNLTLINRVKCMLVESGLPLEMWELAIRQAVYIHNRLPHKSVGMRTPFELFTGHTPDLSNIYRFGCVCYIRKTRPTELNAPQRLVDGKMVSTGPSKFVEKGKRGYLVGATVNSQLVLFPIEREIVTSCDILVTEEKLFKDFHDKDYLHKMGWPLLKKNQNLRFPITAEEARREIQDGMQYLEEFSETPAQVTAAKKLAREKFEHQAWEKERVFHCCIAKLNNCPTTVSEALSGPDRKQWRKAIDKEIASLEGMETWDMVRLTGKEKPIDSRWVFVLKLQPDGSNLYKARLVIRGFRDHHIYDFSEVYAPVIQLNEVRLVLAIATANHWELHQMDVETAFLNGELEKPVHMQIPEGFDVSDNYRKTHCCKLKKSLYGLKVSPKRWYVQFAESMAKLGFTRWDYHACLFYWRESSVRKSRSSKFVLVMVYVDDIIVTGNCHDKIIGVKAGLTKRYKIHDLGTPKKFLGINLVYDRREGTLVMDQVHLIDKMLEKFGLEKVKSTKTPMRTNQAVHKSGVVAAPQSTLNLKKKIPYRELLGVLMYIASCVRPDIQFAANMKARKQSDYDLEDWIDLEHLVGYLKYTREVKLVYDNQRSNGLIGFSDASLGTNDPEGKSTTGFVIQHNGNSVAWASKKQTNVSTSTMESEWLALCKTNKVLDGLHALEKLILVDADIPILYGDNTAAVQAAKSDVCTSLKHLVSKLSYHYVRESVRKETIDLRWISTVDQLADGLTKALVKNKFEPFRDQVLNYNFSESDQ